MNELYKIILDAALAGKLPPEIVFGMIIGMAVAFTLDRIIRKPSGVTALMLTAEQMRNIDSISSIGAKVEQMAEDIGELKMWRETVHAAATGEANGVDYRSLRNKK